MSPRRERACACVGLEKAILTARQGRLSEVTAQIAVR